MSINPYRPIDEPITVAPLPFKYRSNWEIMLFFDVSLRTMEKGIGSICRDLYRKLEARQNGELEDALGDIPEGYTRLGILYHLSDVPGSSNYNKAEAVYERIFGYLGQFSRIEKPFGGVGFGRRWRFLQTVIFGISDVTDDFLRISSMQRDDFFHSVDDSFSAEDDSFDEEDSC